MGKFKDLTGKTFGRLTVIEKAEKRSSQGAIMWRCRCICGNESNVSTSTLNARQTLSCGCIRNEKLSELGKQKAKDITGQKFGRLIAIEPTDNKNGTHIIWKCKCDCGQENVYVSIDNLTTRNTSSCGCIQKEKAKRNASKNIDSYKKKHYIANTRMDVINNNKAFKNSKTGIRGVIFEKGKYRASIQFQKKTYNLGRHFTKEEAKKAREEAELKLHGDFLKWYNEKFNKNKALKND